tara:strand:+ start:5793 stop:6155 length:363 start_codon:yes stop_codon:yes gene_type:complete
MSRTKAQVVTYTAEMMGLIGTGETQTTDMTDDLGLAYDQLYAELDRIQTVEWASTSCPDEHIEDFACMMAVRRSHRWDIPDKNYQRIVLRVGVDGKKGADNLRTVMAKPWSGQTIAGSYM